MSTEKSVGDVVSSGDDYEEKKAIKETNDVNTPEEDTVNSGVTEVWESPDTPVETTYSLDDSNMDYNWDKTENDEPVNSNMGECPVCKGQGNTPDGKECKNCDATGLVTVVNKSGADGKNSGINVDDDSDDEDDISDDEGDTPRPIKYHEVSTEICYGDKAITCARMKEIVGWESESKYKERMKREVGNNPTEAHKILLGYGENYLLKTFITGEKIRCNNINKNREISLSTVERYAQEVLHSGPGLPKKKRAWKRNGSTMVVGKTGEVLDSQHRGLGFIEAVHEWRRDRNVDGGKLWGKIWPTEPVFEIIMVTGVEESQDVIQTLDTNKVRKYRDNLFTSSSFRKLSLKGKKKKSRMLEAAVSFVAKRTGYATTIHSVTTERERNRLEGKGSGVLTHTQLGNFLRDHPKLIECVDFIYGEDGDNKLSGDWKLSPGMCAGLYYMMRAANTELLEYQKTRSEKSIDFSLEEHAHGFWIDFVTQTKVLEGLRQAITRINETDRANGIFGTRQEQIATIIHAWHDYVTGTEVTVDSLDLQYKGHVIWDNTKSQWDFVNPPYFAGIDVPISTNTYDPDQQTIQNETEAIQRQEKERVEEARKATLNRGKAPDILDPKNASSMADEIKKGLASSRANRLGLPAQQTKFTTTPSPQGGKDSTPPSTVSTAVRAVQETPSTTKGPKLRGGV